MKQLDRFGKMPGPVGQELERIHQDNERMRTSDIGVDDMVNLFKGKQTKPRAVRNWEKNRGGG